MNIAVIGGGIGGLTAASMLASKGHTVDLYEKNSYLGGKASELTTNGFRFDRGPSLITMPFVFENIFKQSGKNFADYCTIKKLPTLCKYYYPDGTVLHTYNEKDKLYKELTEKTKATTKQLDDFFAYCADIYQTAKGPFLYNPFLNNISLQSLAVLPKLAQLDPFRTMTQAIEHFFDDPKVVQLFQRYATYTGSNPYVAPATLNIIPHVEYYYGGYYCTTGTYGIMKAFAQLAKDLGVHIYLNTEIESIHTKKNIAKGIVVNNTVKTYDRVVSNADAHHTNTQLIKQKIAKQDPSSSALVFLWGIDKEIDIDIHNILFTNNYKEEFDVIFSGKTYSDPTVYINVTSLYADDAPKGMQNWFVMVNVPYNNGQDWNEIIKKQKRVIIEKVNTMLGLDIEQHIVCEDTLTPKDIQLNTHAYKGGIYGTSSNNKMAAYLRQKNKGKIKNLYYCGGSTHPGGGMTLSALSGTFVARLI